MQLHMIEEGMYVKTTDKVLPRPVIQINDYLLRILRTMFKP